MPAKRYDVVIIGAGLGGLLCAVMLAKEGRRVCVLEKGRQIGGCLQTFSLHRKVFDACVHYIGGLGEGHTLHRIFSYAGIADSLRLKTLDPRGFDRILFGREKEEYPLATKPHFIESLLPFFPTEEAALHQYLGTIEQVTAAFPLYNLKAGGAVEKAGVMGLELMSTLRRMTGDERLAQVLAGNNFLYAGVDGLTPFYVHAMSTEGYLHSAHRAVPGSSQIAKALWKVLQQHGGEIHRHQTVTSLHEKEGRLSHAITADGEEWQAEHFIAAIHPAILFSLTKSKALRPAFRARISGLPTTPPAVMINLVLKPQMVRYQAHNIYWHPSGRAVARFDEAGNIQWPDTQAFFYGEDPAAPGFADTLSILAYADHDAFAAWTDSENIEGIRRLRSSDYILRKEALTDALLEKTYTRFPDLRDAIVARSIATPLTFRDYTGTPSGALYGPLKNAADPFSAMLPVRTKIPNLLLTGQNVNMHGVMGVSITAVATCAELLGTEYLLERIRKA